MKSPENPTAHQQVEEHLEKLRPIPARNAQAAARAQANFLTEIDALEPSSPTPAGIKRWVREHLRAFPRPSFVTPLTAAVLALVFLLSSTVITANAAQDALPGDALYPVKNAFQEAQLIISLDNTRDFQLHLAFAGRAVEDINALVTAQRYDDLQNALDDFKSHITRATTIVDVLTSQNNASALELATQLRTSLDKFAGNLNQVLEGTETNQRTIERVIELLEIEPAEPVEDEFENEDEFDTEEEQTPNARAPEEDPDDDEQEPEDERAGEREDGEDPDEEIDELDEEDEGADYEEGVEDDENEEDEDEEEEDRDDEDDEEKDENK